MRQIDAYGTRIEVLFSPMNTSKTTNFYFSLTLGLSALGNAGCLNEAGDGPGDPAEGETIKGVPGDEGGVQPTPECAPAYSWQGVVESYKLCGKSALFRDHVAERSPDGIFIWHYVRVDDAYGGDGASAKFTVALPSGSNGAASWEAIADDGTYRYYVELYHHPSFDGPGQNAQISVARGPSQPPPGGTPLNIINYEEYLMIDDGTAVEFSSRNGKLTVTIDGVRRDTNVPAPAAGSADFEFSLMVGNPAFYSQTAGMGARDIEFTPGLQPVGPS